MEMKYRKFGKLNWQVSVLGFGVMRLPVINNDQAQINEPEALKMIRYAIDNGLNYLDTGYFYHNGQSEVIVGKALKGTYKDKAKVAVKMPCVAVKSAADFDRLFEEQQKRLDMSKIDFYLLHGLGAISWHKMRDLGIIKWAEKKMAQGCFDHFAFSFHDEYPAFQEIVDGYDNWSFAQVQYNYMDVHRQAGMEGIKYASAKNLGIVVMEPLRGGNLAKKPPESVAKVWEDAPHRMSLAEWGLHWLWDQPEISVVLSGMSTMEQVQENITAAGRSAVGKLTREDHALLDRVREAYKNLHPIPCSGCRYCMPCPNDVAIPSIFEIYNDGVAYNIPNRGRGRYLDTLLDGRRGDQCVQCNICVEHCPQKIDIPEWLEKIHQLLSASKTG
jgi:predicted aldo/keto reductase-like oxidoreductase